MPGLFENLHFFLSFNRKTDYKNLFTDSYNQIRFTQYIHNIYKGVHIMKKIFPFLFVLCLVLTSAPSLFAGGVDNKHNFSVEWVRTLNRNAATDSADGVVYNPAGMMQMENGLFLNLSSQYAIKDYSNTIGGVEYSSDTPSFIPSLFCLYKQDRWAAYAAFTIPSGGGKVEFDNGSATTLVLAQQFMAGANAIIGLPLYDTINSQSLESEVIYYGYTIGGAYSLNKMVSVSLGLRFIDADKEANGSVSIGASSGLAPDMAAKIDYKENADGWGGIIGLNIAPSDEVNIGIRYETKTDLDFKTTVNSDDLGALANAGKARRDLPAILGIGIAYKIKPELNIETDFTYYLNEKANWNGAEDNVDNGYDLGFAIEYKFKPGLKGSIGYMYTDTGIDADYILPEAPQMGAHTVAAGLSCKLKPDLNFDMGILRAFYDTETTSTGMKLEKEVYILAFGIQYKFK